MEVLVFKTKEEMGSKAAADGATFIRLAIKKQGHANIILATGASQFEMLAAINGVIVFLPFDNFDFLDAVYFLGYCN